MRWQWRSRCVTLLPEDSHMMDAVSVSSSLIRSRNVSHPISTNSPAPLWHAATHLWSHDCPRQLILISPLLLHYLYTLSQSLHGDHSKTSRHGFDSVSWMICCLLNKTYIKHHRIITHFRGGSCSKKLIPLNLNSLTGRVWKVWQSESSYFPSAKASCDLTQLQVYFSPFTYCSVNKCDLNPPPLLSLTLSTVVRGRYTRTPSWWTMGRPDSPTSRYRLAALVS